MSGSQNHASTSNTQTQPGHSRDSEPADPDAIEHSDRRSLPLAPSSVKTDYLPEPFLSEKGGAVTVDEAGETYLRIQLSNLENESLTSKHERHKYGLYVRILEADRHFRAEFDGLTTAMLTRRLSPIDETGDWLTPWECNEMLHGGSIHRSVRRALKYNLGRFNFEWIAVTAPTESAGTPHEHIYLWTDDPNDAVTVDHLSPALEKHLKHCTNAHENHHRYRPDGSDGAITLQHTPDLIGEVPDEFFSIAENSPTYKDTGKVLANTRGAQYLASQLAHLPLGDYYRADAPDPPDVLFEGAAMAWASSYNWFRASRGVPS